jgi:hypothetical protein
VGRGNIRLYTEGLLIRLVKIELVTWAHLHTQVAIGARRKIMHGWIILPVEAEHAGGADANA